MSSAKEPPVQTDHFDSRKYPCNSVYFLTSKNESERLSCQLWMGGSLDTGASPVSVLPDVCWSVAGK